MDIMQNSIATQPAAGRSFDASTVFRLSFNRCVFIATHIDSVARFTHPPETAILCVDDHTNPNFLFCPTVLACRGITRKMIVTTTDIPEDLFIFDRQIIINPLIMAKCYKSKTRRALAWITLLIILTIITLLYGMGRIG